MTVRAVALGAALLQVLLMTGYVVLETRYGTGFGNAVPGAVSILVFPAVGLTILRRHPRHRVGLLFCLSQIGWAINNPAGAYARAGALPNPSIAVWLYLWPGVVSSGLTVVLLLVFPDGRFLGPRWRLFGQAVIAVTAVTAVASAIAPGPVDASIGVPVTNPLGVSGLAGDVAVALSRVGLPLQIPLFVGAALAMVLRYRRSAAIQREQLKWFASAVALAVAMVAGQLVLLSVYSDPATAPVWVGAFSQIAILSLSLAPVAAAVAILRYRLYDIDVLIRRTVIYGTTTVGLAVAFFGVILVVQTILSPITRGNELAVAASTLTTLALFGPLQRRVQGVVDRRFYRSRYDAGRTLDDFSIRLRDEVDLDAVRGGLLDAVRDTVQPAHAGVWIRGAR